jgi:transposase
MANKTISMTTLKLVIQQLSKGISRQSISAQYHISRNTIKKYEKRIKAMDMKIEDILKLSDEEISNLLQYRQDISLEENERYQDLMEEMPFYKNELKRTGVTRQLLWKEYLKKHSDGYGYSQFCEHLSKYFFRNDLTMVMQHQYGNCMEVDFAGEKLSYVDFNTGEEVVVPVLVCVLPASVYPYVEALPSAKQEHVYAALSRALHYFGGVPKNILSDNMKQYVEKPSRYEPKFNEIGQEWALHYQTNLTSTRVGKPKDKPTVENCVNQVYMHIYAPLRNQTFNSLGEINTGLWKELNIFVNQSFQRRTGCRHQQFIENEQPVLQSLPSNDFVYTHKVEVKVQKNYHIYLGEDVHYYSVPCKYVGEKVTVVYDTEEVAVYLAMKQIAVHKRSYRKNGYSTYEEHMPENHRHYKAQLGWDSQYFTSIMEKIGAHAKEVTNRILASHNFPEQSYKACCGLISLSKHYGNERFENACQRALIGAKVTYTMIENILKNNLDQQHIIDFSTDFIPTHSNIRGKNTYN